MAHLPSLAAPIPSRPSRTFHLPSSPSTTSPTTSEPSPEADDASSEGIDDDDDDDGAPLPFPTALPRTDFLTPHFSPSAYLSGLTDRHQTLEDLRADLRERSALITAELLELVNANYASFLGLGDELRGGEERVGDVRVALLGFRRAVEDTRAKVRERGAEVGRLSAELGGVRREIETGRKMLELEDRVAALEGRLVVGSLGADSDESDEDEDGEDGEDGGGGVAKLARLAADYAAVDELAGEIGREAPLVRRIEERMARCRNTLLLDLDAALKDARRAGVPGRTRLLRLMGVYAVLDAQAEAVAALKSG